MMWRKRESTSSRGHGKRIEFWLISSPEVATPPALAAFPGPKRIFLCQEKIDTRRDGRHVGGFGNQIATVLNQFLGIFAGNLVLRSTRKRAIAFDPPGPLAGHIF